MKILADAGIHVKDGWITWHLKDHTLRLRDTPENVAKLEAFAADKSMDQLRYGRDHKDDRTIREKIAQDGRSYDNKDKPKSKADILRETLQTHNEVRNGRESFEAHMKREIEAAEIEAELSLDESERQAKAEPRVEHATWAFLALEFSDAPQSEVSGAVKRLELARTGTAVEYRNADAEYRARLKQNAELAKANIEGQFQQQQHALTQQIAALESAAWVDTPAPNTESE